ncbi:MAG: hypothetical protein U0791_23975 [Gemmataceae bacterium]
MIEQVASVIAFTRIGRRRGKREAADHFDEIAVVNVVEPALDDEPRPAAGGLPTFGGFHGRDGENGGSGFGLLDGEQRAGPRRAVASRFFVQCATHAADDELLSGEASDVVIVEAMPMQMVMARGERGGREPEPRRRCGTSPARHDPRDQREPGDEYFADEARLAVPIHDEPDARPECDRHERRTCKLPPRRNVRLRSRGRDGHEPVLRFRKEFEYHVAMARFRMAEAAQDLAA